MLSFTGNVMKWLISAGWSLLVLSSAVGGEVAPSGWTGESPRDEIRPVFSWKASGGPDGKGEFGIASDNRDGLSGYWMRRLPVTAGQFYRFSVDRQTDHVAIPRRTAVARIVWADDRGGRVLRREPAFSSYRPGERPRAEPEFPKVEAERDGWTRLSGTYQVPPDATQAQVELHFRWGPPESSVRWSVPTLEQVAQPPPRVVRLATVHLRPKSGETPQDKCEQFAFGLPRRRIGALTWSSCPRR